MRRYAWIVSLFVFLTVMPCLAAGDVSVSLDLDRKETTTADAVKLLVSVSGTRETTAPPQVFGLGDFDVSRGGTSSRVEIVNGRMNAAVVYTYFIQPKKTGTFQVGPAEVRVGDRIYRSNRETLKVYQASQGSGVDRGPYFLEATLSSPRVYVEEEVLYTLKLFHRVNVKDLSLQLPEVEHLDFKSLGKPREYQEVHGGRSYHVVEVRYRLIASRAGVFGLGAARMRMTVLHSSQRSRRGFFDDPFFSAGRPASVESRPVELEVLALPRDGRPVDFSGLVGRFTMKSRLEPGSVKAGESATLTVLLEGRGNVERIPDLRMPDMERVKLYADQPVLDITSDGQGMKGTKMMKWALVPEAGGSYQVPSLSVSFFDTGLEQYRVLKTAPHSLEVLPAEEENIVASTDRHKSAFQGAATKQEIKEVGQDILPVHDSLSDATSGLGTPGPISFWLLLLGPFLIYAGTLLTFRFLKTSEQSMAATKARRAARNFSRLCRHEKPSAARLTVAVRDYFNDRFCLALGTLTPQEAARILRSHGAGGETADQLAGLLKDLENAVYTGRGHQACEMGEDAEALIKQIEKEIQ
jgi:hypothetical protein